MTPQVIDPRTRGPGLGLALRRVAAALAGAAPVSPDPEYRAWLALCTPSPGELPALAAREEALPYRPTFEVAVLRRPGDGAAFRRTAASLSAQTYRRAHLLEVQGEAGLAQALAGAPGELALVLEPGDVLAPHALFALAEAADPESDLVYADEDRIGVEGRESPFFKPGWSPHQASSHDYVGRAGAFRRSLLARTAADLGAGATSRERLAALAPEMRTVRHVPDVLLQAVPGRGEAAAAPAPAGARPGPAARVAAVIPTKDKGALLAACLASLERHPNRSALELVVVDDGSVEEDARALLRRLATRPGCQVLRWNRPFNWSAVSNAGARLSSADHLLFLNNDVEAMHPGWLDALVELARDPRVGAVGAQLLYPDGALQHYGVVVGMTGFAGHLLQGCDPAAPSRCGPADVLRNCSAVTGACLLTRRDVFQRLGGFDERFVLCGSDVALGLRAMEAGLWNVVTPAARLLHHESRTRGSTVPPSDYRTSLEVYEPWLWGGDPFYNPNLSLRDTRARLRLAREDMLAVARRIARCA